MPALAGVTAGYFRSESSGPMGHWRGEERRGLAAGGRGGDLLGPGGRGAIGTAGRRRRLVVPSGASGAGALAAFGAGLRGAVGVRRLGG
jgi:hypothetical protein